MNTIVVSSFDGIKDDFKDILYDAMKTLNISDRLLVCLYFMSDLKYEAISPKNVEKNLIKIFPPSIEENYLPKDYLDFKTSCITDLIYEERWDLNHRIKTLPERLWTTPLAFKISRIRNTPYANKEAISILKDKNIIVLELGKHYSWELITKNIAIKTIDKSTFLHNGTGVPLEVKYFFDYSLKNNQKKAITLIYKGKKYNASFRLNNHPNPRAKITWKSDFTDFIKQSLPKYYDILKSNQSISDIDLPKIRFQKNYKDIYVVDFIFPFIINSDVHAMEVEEKAGYIINDEEFYRDGKQKDVYGIKYERNPKNRRKAIEYHGTVCNVCNFDFEKNYGKRGLGYIEVHHIKPLNTTGEININPKNDLITVCSNCHRMIHRKQDNVLSIKKMKELLEAGKSN